MITRRDCRFEPAAEGAPFVQVAVDINYATHIYRRMVRDRYAKNAGAVFRVVLKAVACARFGSMRYL